MYTGISEEIERGDILLVLKKKIEEYYLDLKENNVIFAKPEIEENEDNNKVDGRKKGKKK